MSMIHLFSDTEQETLRRWYPYAKAFGYRTTSLGEPGEHSGFMQRLHGHEDYLAITALSDNVFRNVIQYNRDGLLLGYDVYGKATQVEQNVLGNTRALCCPGASAKQLLEEFFDDHAMEFSQDLSDFDTEQDMSTAFHIIVLSALGLLAIADGRKRALDRIATQIVELKDEHEAEEKAAEAESSDSDYEETDEED